MTLNEEIAALERLLLNQRRAPRNVRLLRDVHARLLLFRDVIRYLEANRQRLEPGLNLGAMVASTEDKP